MMLCVLFRRMCDRAHWLLSVKFLFLYYITHLSGSYKPFQLINLSYIMYFFLEFSKYYRK